MVLFLLIIFLVISSVITWLVFKKKSGKDKTDILTLPENGSYRFNSMSNVNNSISLSISVSSSEKTSDVKNAEELLKKATSFYGERDYKAAIDCLRRSYKTLKNSGISYPINTYIRLPSYLMRSGEFDEGISEAMNLIAWIPSRIENDFSHCKLKIRKAFICSEKAQVYHTMSFLSGLSKKWTYSLLYEVTSHALECLALKYNPKGQDRRSKQSRSAWRELIKKQINKGELQNHENSILDLCMIFSKECSEEALISLHKSITNMFKLPIAYSG